MKEYFVIFILFTIFILYSVTLVSKDLNRMRCIEGFEASAPTFLQAIGSSACSNDKQMHYEHNALTNTYQLQCYDQCSTDNTNVPVTEGRSNCMIPSDSNDSNCVVTVSTKCYLDGAFHEISSNVNMYCPDSGYADCGECDVTTQGTCSNVGDRCQRTDPVTLPTGYARCILDSNLDGLTYLEGDSNVRFACSEQECSGPSDSTVPSLTRITDGSCSSLECYGDAEYNGDRFDIREKVLGIKIPQNRIKTHNDNGNFDFKYVILNFNRQNHDNSWNLDMSIGICKETDKLMNPLSTSIINNIKEIFNSNLNSSANNYNPRRSIEYALSEYNGTPIVGMSNDEYSAEVITLNGGGYSVYFNFIKEGNKFHDFWNTDKVTPDQDSDSWIKHSRTRVRFEFRKNGTKVVIMHTKNRPEHNSESMNRNANVSFTEEDDDNVDDTNIANHYIFLKGGPSHNLHVSNLSFS